MVSTTGITVIYGVLTIVVFGAWVAGFLDRYQKLAQNAILGAMGDNRMSYGLKSTIKNQQVSDDKDLQFLQGSAADTAGGLVGKGGPGQVVGDGVSKGL